MSVSRSEPLSESIAAFICDTGPASLSPVVRERAVHAILDTIAVSVAGGAEEPVKALERSLDPAAAQGACRVPWSRASYRPDDAALLWGMASHVLDYDDVCMPGGPTHPSAPGVAVLLSMVDAGLVRPSGEELLRAYCVGSEVLVRLGQAMGVVPYELGFHATATFGTVGAAATASCLLRLDQRTTRNALAIACSMAGGLRKNFGSMIKPLHVGLAAANGLRAARMAAAGVQGSPEPLEEGGFFKAFSGGRMNRSPDAMQFGKPFMIEQEGFSQKRYPCCYGMHRIIAGMLSLRRESGCTLDDVVRMHVRVPDGGTMPLIHDRPSTGLHAKFSAPFAAVAPLLDGKVDLASFEDAAVLRPVLQRRLADVQVVEDDTPSIATSDLDGPVTVSLSLRDGRLLQQRVVVGPGSTADPLDLSERQAKWMDCFRHGAGNAHLHTAARLFAAGSELETMAQSAEWVRAICSW